MQKQFVIVAFHENVSVSLKHARVQSVKVLTRMQFFRQDLHYYRAFNMSYLQPAIES